MALKINLKIDKSKARDTGLAMVLICLILLWWQDKDIFMKLAVILLIATMTFPIVFKPLAYVWFGFAHILGTIASSILLFLVFILVVSPMGLFRRMIGKDPLKLKNWKKDNGSVFQTRDHLFTSEDLNKPY